MPVHDWTRVDQSAFYSFFFSWIGECAKALNRSLPSDHYALVALRTPAPPTPEDDDAHPTLVPDPKTQKPLIYDPPTIPLAAETDHARYRRWKNVVNVHHVNDHRVVARVELVLPSDKASRRGMRELVEKVADCLDQCVHVLVIDLHAPGPRDPHGIHAEIWEDFAGDESPLLRKPSVLASYDAGPVVRAFVETVAVGEETPAMPLFLQPGAYLSVPLESIYLAALESEARHIRRILER